ncbi:hypothetical protein [Flavobacterium sp. 3HN19-14]|uniref:hypothetical protein n=1 Tax=Flavobacterium sp. 3HN19-14 TaxID=3448133 RepID=UPI003EDEB004
MTNAPDISNFICKFSADGTEEWIVELSDNFISDLKADASDNLYFLTSYQIGAPVQFGNATTGNLPVMNDFELALFKIDSNRNLIWDFPIFGLERQKSNEFAINSLGEVIVPVTSERNTELHYANQNTTIATGTSAVTLFKIKPDGNLSDFKRLYDVTTTEESVFSLPICTDSHDDIILEVILQPQPTSTPTFMKRISKRHLLISIP